MMSKMELRLPEGAPALLRVEGEAVEQKPTADMPYHLLAQLVVTGCRKEHLEPAEECFPELEPALQELPSSPELLLVQQNWEH
jgi:hypothetical protein